MIIHCIILSENQTVKRRFEGIKTAVSVPDNIVVPTITKEEKQTVKHRFDGIITGAQIPEFDFETILASLKTDIDKRKRINLNEK